LTVMIREAEALAPLLSFTKNVKVTEYAVVVGLVKEAVHTEVRVAEVAMGWILRAVGTFMEADQLQLITEPAVASVASPVMVRVVPLATVTLAVGALMIAVMGEGAGLTVMARVVRAETPALSVAVKVTEQTRLAPPVLMKVWVAEPPAAVAPSPKVQA